ncbi:MAG: oligosaccharide flippase family protein [Acidimicrobiales bacterium]
MDADGGTSSSLRELALRSAGYLAGREVLGMLLRLGGIVVTMREIGPSGYGLFTGATAFVVFVSALAQMGTEIYLIRSPEAPTRRTYNEAFTLLLVLSLLVTAASLALTVPLGPLLRPVGVLPLLRVLLLVVPLNVLWAPAQACIEREFGYRRMSILELGGDVALYGTAVPLALLGWGPWSLVAGYFVWQAWLFFGSLAFSGLRPRLAWSSTTLRGMFRHGSGFTLSTCTANSMLLVVPLVVGTFAGAAGVGYVNFAVRLVAMLNFTKRGVFRIGMVAVSRARNGGSSGLARGLEEGSLLVLLASAVPFAGFGLLARWLVPLVFGKAWVPAIPLYVVMAVVAVLAVPNLVQRTVLYAAGRNVQAAASHLSEVVVLAVASLVLVPTVGIVGYGYASGLALVSMVVTRRFSTRVCPMSFRRLLLPLFVLVPPLVAPLLSYPRALLTLLPAGLLLVSSDARRDVRFVAGTVRTILSRGSAPTGLAPAGEQPDMAAAVTIDAPATAGAGTWPSAAPGTWPGTAVPAPGSPARGLALHWLLPADALAGAVSLDVMLARAGRLLGATRRSGWPLMVAAFELRGATEADEELRHAVAAVLRTALRYDDPVARAEPSTFVVATALVPGGADGGEVARHLAASVGRIIEGRSAGGRVTLRSSHVVTTAHSAEEVDELVRRAVEDLDGR